MTTDPTAADRQPAYDAVFAYIRQQPRDFLPTNVVDRNAMIWRAVNAALDAVVSPPTDRADLRERIADVLAEADGWKWVTDRDRARSSTYRSYQSRAAAVLAVLGEQTDQAAVLLEAADHFDRMGRTVLAASQVRDELRRLAVEAHGTGTQQSGARCSCGGTFPLNHLHADTHEPAPVAQQPAAEAEQDDTVHACPGRWGGPNCRCFDAEPAPGEQQAAAADGEEPSRG